MSDFEVPNPILNSPVRGAGGILADRGGRAAGAAARAAAGRLLLPRPEGPRRRAEAMRRAACGASLALVNLIRARMARVARRRLSRRHAHDAGIARSSGAARARHRRLFFAQLEAAETIIFLTEARPDFLQGIDVPLDEPSDDRQADGFKAFRRYACKMATGSGKTTVMGMLAAWSILNKVNDRCDARFSDVVLVVCPNVTIRERLGELDPRAAKPASTAPAIWCRRTLMPDLTPGPRAGRELACLRAAGCRVGGVGARVIKAGRPVRSERDDHDRGRRRHGPRPALHDAGGLERAGRGRRSRILGDRDRQHGQPHGHGGRRRAMSRATRRWCNRILGREVGGKQNILVINDEAHHAYRIRSATETSRATTTRPRWRTGEDAGRVRQRGDGLGGRSRPNQQTARHQFLRRSLGDAIFPRPGRRRTTNRSFPWVVSDFGLIDAIESGLVENSATRRAGYDRAPRCRAISTSGTGFWRG